MKETAAVLLLACFVLGAHALTNEEVIDKLNATKHVLELMNKTIQSIQKQLILNQLYIDEKVRSDGDSGIKQIRGIREGTKSYYSESHTGNGVCAMYNHGDNIRTIGLGEVSAVLNGIDFRTRHNDYRLYMPSTTTNELHEYEDVPFPDIPPEVLAKATVDEQIVEMREWFKAWQSGSTSPRDYRKYFKPVISYLEGVWLYADDEIDEGFSDRHQINADSIGELMNKIMYASYTGSKESGENLAYIPRVLWNVTEDGHPLYAQWNYRIMCHPIQQELPLSRIKVVDDLKVRMSKGLTIDELPHHAAARFQLLPQHNDNDDDRQVFKRLLEDIFNEIPGKENYGTTCEDHGLDGLAKDPQNQTLPLNACNYHRQYSISRDASGHSNQVRGWADLYLFMALNNQSLVMPMYNPKCATGESECLNPEERLQRWSYAIPMEIIWLTPLNTWNPYNITYRGDAWTDDGKKVREGGRNGQEDKPFNGVNHNTYYITPNEFFGDGDAESDPADTGNGAVYVLDNKNVTRLVRSSGVRIFFPEIGDLGIFRQRYPIMPVHGEGSAVWKELDALKQMVLSPNTHSHMFYESFAQGGGSGGYVPKQIEFTMGMSQSTSVSQHTHTFTLSESERMELNSGKTVTVETDQGAGHTHALILELNTETCKQDQYSYSYTKCDGADLCWDGHGICNAAVG